MKGNTVTWFALHPLEDVEIGPVTVSCSAVSFPGTRLFLDSIPVLNLVPSSSYKEVPGFLLLKRWASGDLAGTCSTALVESSSISEASLKEEVSEEPRDKWVAPASRYKQSNTRRTPLFHAASPSRQFSAI